MSVTEACIQRPILAWVIMISITLLGGLTLTRLGVTDTPEYTEPAFSVSASVRGASPEQMESSVVTIIEDALAGVQGVDEVTSTASQGSANVKVRLRLQGSRSLDAVIAETQQRLAGVQWRMPRDMRPPVVEKGNDSDTPVAYLVLEGPVGAKRLSDLGRTLVRPAFQAIPGVSTASVWGTRDRQVRVWLDPQALWEHNLTAQEVRAALQREHVPAAGGSIEDHSGVLTLDVTGNVQQVQDLAALPLKSTQPGQPPITLASVGVVEDGFVDDFVKIRFNGVPAAVVAVNKQRGANAVAVATEVRRVTAHLNESLPSGVHVRLSFDMSARTREAAHDLAFELLLAIAITGLCCRLFLGNWQSTLNVFLAIPMSLLGACAVLSLCDFTLNVYTMLGLTIAVGIVVDDAIMVLESIDREHRAGGDAIAAAVRGTRRIAFAALAATVGVVCIFAPVMFMQGATGKNFLELGVTLSVAVVLSYVEAVTLAPARCAQLLARTAPHVPSPNGPMARFETAFGAWLVRCMRRPARTLGISLLLCAAGWSAFAAVPSAGQGEEDDGMVQLMLDAPVDFGPAQSVRAATEFEAMLRALPAVDSTVFLYGNMGANRILGFVMLKPAHARSMSTRQMYAQIYGALPKYPQLQAHEYGGGALSWTLRGPARHLLQTQAQHMQAALRAHPQFANVTTDKATGPPRLVLQPNRQAMADAQVPVEEVATAVNMLYAGTDAGWFDLDGQHADIRMRLLASARAHVDGLQDITVRAPGARLLPLAGLVDQHTEVTPLSLMRRDRQRALDMSAQLAPGADPDAARAAVRDWAASHLPSDVQLAWEGGSRRQDEGNQQLVLAMGLGVIFAYLVLAAQLNSLSLPVLVLSAIPMAAAGAGVALWARGLPLGEITQIGLLLLFGLVKKNAIMLVDCAVVLRNQGMSHFDSAAQAARTRLRPILMTTCATAVAVLPAAFALGPGGGQRMGMAWVVLGGLLSSTLMSLVAVPCVLSLGPRCTAPPS